MELDILGKLVNVPKIFLYGVAKSLLNSIAIEQEFK